MNILGVKGNYAKLLDLVLFAAATVSAAAIVIATAKPDSFGDMNVFAGVTFTVCVALLIYLHLNPDSVRARQSDTILKIASETLACFQEGLSVDTAQKVCRLLLPATGAHAVAITDKDHIRLRRFGGRVKRGWFFHPHEGHARDS